MSIELLLDEEEEKEKENKKEKENNNKIKNLKEKKWKELLYELFYEIKSEILGCKIEIEEEEYQENIKSITIPKLVDYIHDSIQILINKKIDDSKKEQRELDDKYYKELNKKNNKNIPLNLDERTQYENIILKLESKERILTKFNFQDKLQKDAMENKIEDYMEMEEEFEEMKTKLKYEGGRFLNNDRKENEIIIMRAENSNLKQSIIRLENKIYNLENDKKNNNKLINNLQEQIKQLKLKIEDFEKQIDILKSHSINININNVSGTNNKNGIINNNINNLGFKEENIFSKNNNNLKNKIFPFKKIKNKYLQNKKHNSDILSNTRNESLERTKSDLFSKYLIGNKINRNNNNMNNKMHLNNSSIRVNQIFNVNGQFVNERNHDNYHMPVFRNKSNFNNYNITKKIISSGGNNSSRANSTKGNNGIINYI